MKRIATFAIATFLAGCGPHVQTESEKAVADLAKSRATFDKNVKEGEERRAEPRVQPIDQAKVDALIGKPKL